MPAILGGSPNDNDPYSTVASMPRFKHGSVTHSENGLPQPETDPDKRVIDREAFIDRIAELVAEGMIFRGNDVKLEEQT